jgi:hypothetical protein
MSRRVKAGHTGSRAADTSAGALRDYEEVQRRRSERIAEKLLKEAAPRFRDKGWKVTDGSP